MRPSRGTEYAVLSKAFLQIFNIRHQVLSVPQAAPFLSIVSLFFFFFLIYDFFFYSRITALQNFVVSSKINILKIYLERPPWWSSGLDTTPPMQGARVQSLVGELDSICHN